MGCFGRRWLVLWLLAHSWGAAANAEVPTTDSAMALAEPAVTQPVSIQSRLRSVEVSPGQLIELEVEIITFNGWPVTPRLKKSDRTDLIQVKVEGYEPEWWQGHWRQRFHFEWMALTVGKVQLEPISFRFDEGGQELLTSKPHDVEVIDVFAPQRPEPQEHLPILWPAEPEPSYGLALMLLIIFLVVIVSLGFKLTRRSLVLTQPLTEDATALLKHLANTEQGERALLAWCQNHLSLDPMLARAQESPFIAHFQSAYFKPNRSQSEWEQLIEACQKELDNQQLYFSHQQDRANK